MLPTGSPANLAQPRETRRKSPKQKRREKKEWGDVEVCVRELWECLTASQTRGWSHGRKGERGRQKVLEEKQPKIFQDKLMTDSKARIKKAQRTHSSINVPKRYNKRKPNKSPKHISYSNCRGKEKEPLRQMANGTDTNTTSRDANIRRGRRRRTSEAEVRRGSRRRTSDADVGGTADCSAEPTQAGGRGRGIFIALNSIELIQNYSRENVS